MGVYQGWGIRPGLSLKPVIPHLTDGGHQPRRMATAPPGWTRLWELWGVWVPAGLRSCWIRGCSTFTFFSSGPCQSSTRAGPRLIHTPLYLQCNVTATTSQCCHQRAILDPQREPVKTPILIPPWDTLREGSPTPTSHLLQVLPWTGHHGGPRGDLGTE